jgi:hypothetical protein
MAIGQGLTIKNESASTTAGKIVNSHVTPSNPLPTIGPLVKYSTTTIDTVVKRASVRTDTVLISGTKWSKLILKGMASTDSLEYGYGLTAPTTFRRTFGTTPVVIEYLDKTYFTKVFIRAFGAVSSVRTYELNIESY